MEMSDQGLVDYYASIGKDQFGNLFPDRTPGAFDRTDFSNVDLGQDKIYDKPNGDLVRRLKGDPTAEDIAREIEEFDGGMLLDDADQIINNEINEGGDQYDVRRALRSLVAQYQGDEKPPKQTVEMLMAYASMGQ